MLFRIFSSNDFCFDQDFYESCCSPFTLLLLVYLITSCTVLGYKEIFYHHPRFPYSRFSSHLPFLPLPLSLPYDLYDYIAHFFPLFRTYFFILYLTITVTVIIIYTLVTHQIFPGDLFPHYFPLYRY